MEKNPVVITGVGPVTAIGSGRESFWSSLIGGKSGVTNITRCDTSRSACKIGAELKDFRLQDYLNGDRRVPKKLPRAIELGMAAAALALQDAGIDRDNTDRDRIGVFVGTSVANLGETLSVADQWRNSKERVRPDTSFYLFNHSIAAALSSYFDLRGPSLTITTGCNSGLDALGQAARLIEQDLVDGMLVVGADCALFPEILAVFNAAGSLSTKYNEEASRTPRPFDAGRDGVVLGEGAGALWLEPAKIARARKATVYARLAGYAAFSAGRHRTYSTDPEWDLQPSVRAMRETLKQAHKQPEDINLFHANGSASVHYDRLEANAIAQTFGKYFEGLAVHSIKSMIGLPGGAASALQAITACLSLRDGMIPPTLNHENSDPLCGPIRVITKCESFQPRNVLIHSIGFGGFYYSAAAICNI